MSEAASQDDFKDVPTMMDAAASELDDAHRELELLRAQMSVIGFIDRVMLGAANLKPGAVTVARSSAVLLRSRAAAMRRMSS